MIKNLSLKKLIATVVLTTFIYIFVLHEAVYGVSATINEISKVKEVISKIEGFGLPYRLGRVMYRYNNGSEIGVVLIQDLHCHPEVQKNICEIIKFLDDKYEVSKIFVEGAPQGQVDTKILSFISDEKIKKKVLDSLINKGLITGAEYYCVVYNKDKLYGLEELETYLSNYKRLKNILLNKDRYIKVSKTLNYKIDMLKKRYLSKKIKKLEKILTKERKKEEYYLRLEKLCKKLNIGLNFYPNLARCIEIVKLNKEINFKHIKNELKNYFKELQNIVPYGIYSELINKQENSELEEYYLTLSKIAKEYTPNIRYKYPNLDKLFEYVNLNYGMNPLYLILEEKALIRNILRKFADKQIDKEILFMSEMGEYLKNLSNLNITYEEFNHFSKNIDRFKILLKKYFEDYEISDVIKLIDNKEIWKFYETNIIRDKIFYKTLTKDISLTTIPSRPVQKFLYNDTNISADLKNFKQIFIVVVGGFHLNLQQMLSENGISCITITPNVTKNFDNNTVYENLITENIDIKYFLSSTFAPPLLLYKLNIDPKTQEGVILSLIMHNIILGKSLNEIRVPDGLNVSIVQKGEKGNRYEIKIGNNIYEFEFRKNKKGISYSYSLKRDNTVYKIFERIKKAKNNNSIEIDKIEGKVWVTEEFLNKLSKYSNETINEILTILDKIASSNYKEKFEVFETFCNAIIKEDFITEEFLNKLSKYSDDTIIEILTVLGKIASSDEVFKTFCNAIIEDKVDSATIKMLFNIKDIQDFCDFVHRLAKQLLNSEPKQELIAELSAIDDLLEKNYEILRIDKYGNIFAVEKDGFLYIKSIKTNLKEVLEILKKLNILSEETNETNTYKINYNMINNSAEENISKEVKQDKKDEVQLILRSIKEKRPTGIKIDIIENQATTNVPSPSLDRSVQKAAEAAHYKVQKVNPFLSGANSIAKVVNRVVADRRYLYNKRIMTPEMCKNWMFKNAPELYGKTVFHISPGIKPSPDFLKVFSIENNKIKVANAHQTGGLEPLITEELVKLIEFGMNPIGITLLYKYAPMQKEDGTIQLEAIDYSEAINKGKLIYLGKIIVPIEGKNEEVKVWAAPFKNERTNNNAVVIFLDHPLATEIYPQDLERRMQQMLLLGRGSLAVIKEIVEGNRGFKEKLINLGLPFNNIEPAIVQMNEALTVFAHPDAVLDEFSDPTDPNFSPEFYNLLKNKVVFGFTTHTPVASGLQKLPKEWCERIRLHPKLWNINPYRNDQIDCTKIAMYLADVINAVSNEHAKVTERDLYPELKGWIKGIVNGIGLPDWQLPEMAKLVGKKYNKTNVEEMVKIHKKAKEEFADWIHKQVGGDRPNTSRLFSVEARRKTDFKSVDAFIQAMYDNGLRNQFLDSNVIQIFLGKPHISDNWGLARVKELIALSKGRIIKVDKDTMQETEIARDERLIGRIIFIPNFNVADAPIIFQGADAICMWSKLETEASATGYMKGLSNGIPTIATKTGGPLEHIYEPKKEEEVGNGVFVKEYLPDKSPSPKGIIDALDEISKIYTSGIGQGNWDNKWYKMMWNALQTTVKIDIAETMKRYIKELWLPAYMSKIERQPARRFRNLAVIVPIFALRNKAHDWGIGKIMDLKEVYENVLKPAGVNVVLLLPHFPPSEESPYSPVSVYSINEDYIDWIKEAERIGLTREEIEDLKKRLQEEVPSGWVNYEKVREREFKVALEIHERALRKRDKEFENFQAENSLWLTEYAEYMAAYKILGRPPTSKEEIQNVAESRMKEFVDYETLYEYMQYVAYRQLKEVVEYIHSEGGKIMFDMPFFRGKNSVDVVYHREFFDSNLRSPGIRGQNWEDLVLYNWDSLKSKNYELLISPIKHWLKFGFDGLRLDAIHFAYPLRELGDDVTQSGNEKGDEFVAKLAAAIRSVNPRAIVVAEAFEKKDEHIRDNYGFYTIANIGDYNPDTIKNIKGAPKVWLQITSHDSPRIQNDGNIIYKYGISRASLEESFRKLFASAINSNAEFVCFTIGDQYGDERPIKQFIQEGGKTKTLWRYRIPFEVDPNKQFDITKFISKLVFSPGGIKTETELFQEGYLVGINLKLPKIDTEIIKKLQKIENFTLRYNYGQEVLYTINAPGLHSLLVAYQCIKFYGEKGKWSLLHHSYHNDFFNKLYSVLNNAGLTKDVVPEVWRYIEQLDKQARMLTDVGLKADINIQLFGFIQGLLENILYQKCLSNKNLFGVSKENEDIFRKLLVAADSFIVRDKNNELKIFAGYPWFDQSWGRDTFISLPGLLLTTGRYEEAKEVFRYYAKHQRKDGIIPNRIWDENKIEYNTADASLWFIEALYRYYKQTEDTEFVKEMLPIVDKILSCYTKQTGEIYLDKDNLVVVPAQWTWMDAAPKGKPVTPRNGKPVEIQALFYNALSIAAEFYRLTNNYEKVEQVSRLKEKVKIAINKRFFGITREYPYDVLDGDQHKDAVRPNAIFLLSLSKVDDLLTVDDLLPLPEDLIKRKIIDTVEEELLTPFGLRTLSPQDPKYIGKYETFAPQEIKDQAYHQGTVWPWLISHYIFAKIKQMEKDGKTIAEIKDKIKLMLNNLIYILNQTGTIPEVFSGSEPFTPGGTFSQAWSVAAMLEVLDIILNSEIKVLPESVEKSVNISIDKIKEILVAV